MITIIVLLTRIFLSSVFLFSGITKFVRQQEFSDSLAQVPFLPEELFSVVAITIPIIECVIGSALLSGFFTKLHALIAASMILLFTAIYTPVLLDPSIKANCACFGAASEINGWFVLRNIVLFTLSFYLFTQDRFILSLDNLKVKK